MGRRRLFLFFLTVFLALAGLSVWTAAAEGQAHYMPDYEKADLMPLLESQGRELAEEDYRLLFFQTGMAKAGIDQLYEAGRQDRLLDLQERFFAEVQVECLHTNMLLRSERLLAGTESGGSKAESSPSGVINGVISQGACTDNREFLPTAQDGDILVTFSGHVFGWRSGHAAVVVNALEGQTLEAITYGRSSAVCSVEHWSEYPCFALLRLKGITDRQQAEIAEYAMEELVDVPYSLFAFRDSGAGDPKALETSEDAVRQRKTAGSPEETPAEEAGPAATQCAHLVWSVYRHFGYDLDSDGGAVVTPADIFHSDLLEIVQIYGIDPENITNF